MPHAQTQFALVRDAGPRDTVVITDMLAKAGIPSALWGVNAAVHYGGELCPLVRTHDLRAADTTNTRPQDFELVVNDADQERIFAILTSQGALPSIDEDIAATRPANFMRWRKLATLFSYRDRRRVRLCTPVYEIPGTGDELDDGLIPFIIIYSAESIGLPLLPYPPSTATIPSPGTPSKPPYVPVSTLKSLGCGPSGMSGWTSLIPTFPRLVESEMHILLHHAEFMSPLWGQHMAQLSALLRSRTFDEGHDCLTTLVNPQLSRFAQWVESDLKGESNYEDLERLLSINIQD